MASAAIMLRLLETQLRDEFEHLSFAFDNAARIRQNEIKTKKFTNRMHFQCRKVNISLDQLCSQPSCPICAEDFVHEHEVLRLPCSHFFHDSCVVPWLQQKQNCPICR